MMNRCLVIGNGTIANCLKRVFSETLQIESTQRIDGLRPNYVDLNVSPSKWNVDFSRFSYVFIAAGIGGEDFCNAQPKLSFKVNVEGTISVLDLASQNHCKPLFISSTYVNSFDSKSEEQVSLFPYTYQKWLVEQEISHKYPNTIVFRPGKVISPEQPFMKQLMMRANDGNAMSIFSDYYLSPTSLSNLGRIIQKLLTQNFIGTFNLVSDKPISYLELAKNWCHMRGISASFLQEVTYPGVKRNVEISHKLSADDLAKIDEVPETLSEILHTLT